MPITSSGNCKALKDLGLSNPGEIFWNPTTPQLYEQIILRREGHLAQSIFYQGRDICGFLHPGRSVKIVA